VIDTGSIYGGRSLRDIAKHVLDRGTSTPASSWLKSLEIPAVAMPDVQKGNRRAGKRFIRSKVKWLADGVELGD
jgi:hypothetical protein